MSEKKPRWYKRFLVFIKEAWAEMKKVTWPSKPEVVNTTLVVIILTVFFGFYLFFMDLIFSWALTKLKDLIG